MPAQGGPRPVAAIPLSHCPMYGIVFSALMLFGYPPAYYDIAFDEQTIDDQVGIGYGLAVGDVDGDGKPDILLADKHQFVWYRNGDWKRFVMVENLTEYDNVCIAARDIDGDGKVEVAVGAQWNPAETSDASQSGSVHYLVRPEDPTLPWVPVKLHHEPTVHRMRWAKTGDGSYQLIVVPLHGRGNAGGKGKGAKVMAYEMLDNDPMGRWRHRVIDQSMHQTHNLDVFADGDGETIYISGQEGIKAFTYRRGAWRKHSPDWRVRGQAMSEARHGRIRSRGVQVIAGIEPLHGNMVTLYKPRLGDSLFVPHLVERMVLERNLAEGHGLVVADFLGLGRDQVVAGWRKPNEFGVVGIKLYIPFNQYWEAWDMHWIDIDGMACEDLVAADLDGDGKLDLIAAGRGTHNLKIYWNRSGG